MLSAPPVTLLLSVRGGALAARLSLTWQAGGQGHGGPWGTLLSSEAWSQGHTVLSTVCLQRRDDNLGAWLLVPGLGPQRPAEPVAGESTAVQSSLEVTRLSDQQASHERTAMGCLAVLRIPTGSQIKALLSFSGKPWTHGFMLPLL